MLQANRFKVISNIKKKPRSMLPPCSSNDSTLKAPLNAKVLKQQNIQIGKKIKLLSSKKKEQNEKNI
jgi:hypothetical protein